MKICMELVLIDHRSQKSFLIHCNHQNHELYNDQARCKPCLSRPSEHHNMPMILPYQNAIVACETTPETPI